MKGGGELAEMKEGSLLAEAKAAERFRREVRAAEELSDLERGGGRAISEVKAGMKEVGLEPCPIGACLIGSAHIATPGGFEPIEDIKVGDRVTSTYVDSSHPDGWTDVDPIDWHVLTLRMDNPQQPGDTYEIEMLRPVGWVVAHGAYPGRTIELATERNARDEAHVVSVEPAPRIATGSGRVVLATYVHQDQILSIRFVGVDEPVASSPWHRLFSVDRHDWIMARDLRVGERVRARSGEATIAAIEQEFAGARVFDIEVERDHAYYLGPAAILSHNCGDRLRDLPDRPGIYHVEAEGRYYTGSAINVRSRVMDPNHPARELFDAGDAKITIWDVDLGHANPALTTRGTMGAAYNHSLRGAEQTIMDEVGNVPRTGGSLNRIRAAAVGRHEHFLRQNPLVGLPKRY